MEVAKKWDKPTRRCGNDAIGKLPASIPLDYYENFDKAVAKDWIIKGVIAKGETSSWIGPPGAANRHS